jgi:hypothetical protein
MIKWLIVAVLVAGSVGFIWTAPWKDEVDTVRARIGASARLLDDATGGDCTAVGTVAKRNVTSAVDDITNRAGSDADARAAARRQADQIAVCIERLPAVGGGWRGLERRLRQAAG